MAFPKFSKSIDRVMWAALGSLAALALTFGCSSPETNQDSSPAPVVQETADWGMIDAASLTTTHSENVAAAESAAIWQEVDFASLPAAPTTATADWSVIDFTGFGS